MAQLGGHLPQEQQYDADPAFARMRQVSTVYGTTGSQTALACLTERSIVIVAFL
jgi:hypothetical protein